MEVSALEGVCSGGVCSGGVSVLGVCSGVSAPGGCLLWGEGCLPWGVCSGGVCSQGGWSAPRGRGVCSQGGGIPACTEVDTSPLWTESQTPVKTLPWPNFVAASNKNAFQ